MLAARRRAYRNPANSYLVLGLLLLAGSLYVPYLTASRTARVEGRAEAIADRLREAVAMVPRELDAVDAATVLARFRALAERDQVPTGDLDELVPPLPGTLLTLRNKHYCFHLAISPPDPKEPVGRDTEPAYEVMAWPRSALGPGHSVFFHAQNSIPAYTRNLAKGYAEERGRRPAPGCAQRLELGDRTTSYRGVDDERWIALPPRAAAL
jgi:hypothetical protein